MTTYDLRKKTNASTGQKIVSLGGGIDSNSILKIQNLETKVAEQSEKLDQIVKLLDDISKRKVNYLKIIQEYKSDKSALKKQIADLQKTIKLVLNLELKDY